ncbi:MAG: DNA primase, partial [Planctomycetes bacterium]|nr:DNA primase [Planctomycetota bacterium]
ANYTALCPFHEEKTPSFVVNPSKQIYHCFGCHKGGNVFTFLMAFEKMEFPAVARMLADRAGIRLPTKADDESDFTREKRAQLLNINHEVTDYFHRCLLESKEGELGRQYLKKRGFTQSMISRFRLGYAPLGWENLVRYADSKKIRTDYLAELGLILPRKEKGGYYDRFRNRLMFPIFNTRDRVVGFGGRALDDSEPVYLNSPESLLFSKGKTLYGLNFARESAPKVGKLCIVEGYTDVIMAHQHGFEYVIATLGTALTTHHIKSIRRFVNKVVMLFDADTAGEMASARSLDQFLTEEMDLVVARLPAGLDPYDCLVQKGADVFRDCIEQAEDLFTYRLGLISRKYNVSRVEDRVKAIDEAIESIKVIPNVVRRNLYIKQLAEALNISESVIRQRLKLTPVAKQAEAKPFICQPDIIWEEEIIELMLSRNDFIPIIRKSVSPQDFPTTEGGRITEAIFKAFDHYDKITVEILMSFVAAEPALAGRLVQIAEKNRLNTVKDCDAYLKELVSYVNNRRQAKAKPLLKQQCKELYQKGDQTEADRLLKEFMQAQAMKHIKV